MSVWVTGDVHGSIDIGKLSGRRWLQGKGLTRGDLLIVCGDFGTTTPSAQLDERHRLIYRDVVRAG